MTTTQATGRDQQVKRLCWLLDTMIEHLDSAPPESALGGIEQYEDEAAELIETTGLADGAGIPAELRPVIQRKEGGHDKKGTEEFAKLVEDAGMKAEFPEDGFPTCVAFRYVTTDCHVSTTRFDWHAASGLGLGPEPDPPRGYKRVKPPPGHPLAELVSSSGPPPLEPDERYIRGFVACLKGWRSRAQWKATSEIPDEHEVIDDPIANCKLADLCDLDPDTVSIQMRKALTAARKAVKTGGAGISRYWTHDQLRAAFAHLPDATLQNYLDSVGFGKPNETRF